MGLILFRFYLQEVIITFVKDIPHWIYKYVFIKGLYHLKGNLIVEGGLSRLLEVQDTPGTSPEKWRKSNDTHCRWTAIKDTIN